MFFIVNALKEVTKLRLVEGEGSTSLNFVPNGDADEYELITATEPELGEAMQKRFKAGTSNIKNLVNRHDLFVSNRLTVFGGFVGEEDQKKVKLSTVPQDYNARTDEEKKMPRNVVIVISSTVEPSEVSMNDDRNILEKTSVVVGNYRLDMYAIKWSNWRTLRHEAAFYIKTGETEIGLKLGVTPNANGRSIDDLIPMEGEDLATFKANQEELQKKAQEERAAKRPPREPRTGNHDRTYNNGGNRSYGGNGRQGNGHYGDRALASRPFNDYFENNRGGNRKGGNNRKGNTRGKGRR